MQSRGLGIDASHHLLFIDDHKLVLKTREPGVIGNTLSLVVADVPRGLEGVRTTSSNREPGSIPGVPTSSE